MVDPAHPDFANTPVAAGRPAFEYVPLEISALPVATIVTPFFNAGETFLETARSVLGQSLQQWEWLIVNDGSTDPQSLSMLEALRTGDPRIRVIDHAQNRGLSAARNTGFRAARAPYVVQLDDDDLLEPTAVEKWCWYLESFPDRSFVKGYTVQFGASACLWTGGFHDGARFLRENRVNPTAAVRADVHRAVQGYDESDRGGLMDWDFWLRSAAAGYWGGTVPEYLDWYRRRERHGDVWPDFDGGPRQRAYLKNLRRKYPSLWKGGFPTVPTLDPPADLIPDSLPFGNLLRRNKRRVLLLLPWMCLGGADRFNLELIAELTGRGWEVTIATTLGGDHTWLPHYARHTPDIFCLHHFLAPRDYPRFLRYLIASRQIDTVLVSHSETGYALLPYLRAHAAGVTSVDYCHIEEEAWKDGGYPRMSIDAREYLDLTIVSSRHLAAWMEARGADRQRIRVQHTNVDTDVWRPDPASRARTRQELGLDSSTGLVLFAGRLHAQKQPGVLAESLNRLSGMGVPFVALLAGEGPERRWLESYVARHRLGGKVKLLGEVDTPRLQALLHAADVFFLPSQWEGIALTLFEALASGVPVVASAVGGQGELVTPECGVLIAPGPVEGQPGQYADALASLLGSPERRGALGKAGRARVEQHFRRAAMGQGMVALLDEADRLRRCEPRPLVPISLGATRARQAVQAIRPGQLSASLWAMPAPDGMRRVVFVLLSRMAGPAYRLADRRGWAWFFRVGERVKRRLAGPADRLGR